MTKVKSKTVSVSLRALIQRINRKLDAEGKCMQKSRSANVQQQLGDFYVIDTRLNAVSYLDVNPEEFGRKIGALKAWEHLEE